MEQQRRLLAIKYGVDPPLALALLVLASPLFALTAAAVLVGLGWPIIFTQLRAGLNGQPFSMFKFRTMVRGAEHDEATWDDPNEASETAVKAHDDPRITPLGRLLRKTSLDELPQLFNVLRGDMSLVGARPERPLFVKQFSEEIDRYDDRHRLPVGITGWAQVHGLRGDTSIVDRARFDNRYIEEWSLWHDVVILGRTVTAVVRDASRSR